MNYFEVFNNQYVFFFYKIFSNRIIGFDEIRSDPIIDAFFTAKDDEALE
jgi:hypothetical protein